jgi:hypothetical protein
MWREDNDDDEEDNDNYFAMPKKHNKTANKCKHKKTKTTINPDLVLGAEFGADAMVNEKEGVPNNDNCPMSEPKKYSMMDKKDWTMCVGGDRQRIAPVPLTGEAEHFGVKLEEGHLEKMRQTWDNLLSSCF